MSSGIPTQKIPSASTQLTLLFDGGCPLCLREVTFLQRRDRRLHPAAPRLAFVDINADDYTPSANGGISYREAMGRIHALTADGEVLLRCPMLLRCYRDGTTPVDGDGWLHTGDLGRWHDDGRLHVEGRRGDLIITGGENVWPDTVEAVLSTHPSVSEVAVAGVPDPEWGQRVVAWVVPAVDGDAPTLAYLRGHVGESLPMFCAPKELRLVESLPRTALGKVQRHVLVQSPNESDSHQHRHQHK